MITYSRRQIEQAHRALNHADPFDARHIRVNHILATMLVHDLGTVDGNVLDEGDAAAIEGLLALEDRSGGPA